MFSRGLLWIFAESREYMKIHKNLRKTNDFRGLRGPNSTPNRHQNGSQGLLEASWGVLGASWGLLGASGAVLGASWAVLGASWAVLGRILAPLSSEMGGSWAKRRAERAECAGRGGAPVRRRRPPGNLFGRKFEGLEDWKNSRPDLARPAPVVNHGGGGSKTPPAMHRRPRPPEKTPPMWLYPEGRPWSRRVKKERIWKDFGKTWASILKEDLGVLKPSWGISVMGDWCSGYSVMLALFSRLGASWGRLGACRSHRGAILGHFGARGRAGGPRTS